jgi:hypothetical protein
MKIGRYNHPNVPVANQASYGVVGSSWKFLAFGTILVIGLNVTVQY